MTYIRFRQYRLKTNNKKSSLPNKLPITKKYIMKQLSFVLLHTLICFHSLAQNDGPRETTAQELENIKIEVENMIPELLKKLSSKQLSPDEIEFTIDTCRIEQMAAKIMNINYSTVGMNNTVRNLTSSYDKLMNKYYNKLLTLLTPDDKRVLITAQKAWLQFRDEEAKLIRTMTIEAYSGGGTMQSNLATASYAELVIDRTNKIFRYYNDTTINKK